ncbi:8-oxo-dGTP diphosphatase [Candidatus Woesearchaeota archaeon]|nr:8-oxo-dGTP diphosphatase [Candidatus Woesearchaeota archaeon]
MKNATLCFLIHESEEKVLLGLKKRGFGAGKYNGFGGKIGEQETIEEAALREFYEETSITIEQKNLSKVAELYFTFSAKPDWDQTVYVFIAKEWQGVPQESEEMKPEWYRYTKIPFSQMWQDDKYWLPLILQGKKLKGWFTFGEDNQSVKEYKIEEY